MAQAKRSPILGYNHNVRYRGVVFHVQTEDSGLLNPHLFTHLFHEGVIVSTRKLVYDAGSNEDAIKALMQAQHKAVMKDLRKGSFDDKIDQYLSGVPGLEPRAGADPAAPLPRGSRAPTEVTPPVASPLEISSDDLSEPIELPLKSRVATGDQTRPVSTHPPAPGEDTAATLVGDSAAELAAAFQESQRAAQEAAEQPVKSRTSTAPKVSRAGLGIQSRTISDVPQLEILEDTPSGRNRLPRDTTADVADGIPTRPTQDSIPPPTTPVRGGTPSSHGAAALPPTKPPTRPPMPPNAAPGSAEGERPGQYSMGRKSGDPIREKTGRIAAINPSSLNQAAPQQPASPPGSGPHRAPNIPREPTPQNPVGRAPTPSAARGVKPPPTPVGRPGAAPQPIRAHVTAPIQNRTPSPATPQPGSGVVMTRPAVIVGAPPKTQQPTTGRVRKAREDEGRGFGQGLISEKSLDEVILAYLSEDAEDK